MPQIIVVFRARARQIDETYMATALKQPVGLKPNRREVVGERGQMCAHSRRIVVLLNEKARAYGPLSHRRSRFDLSPTGC